MPDSSKHVPLVVLLMLPAVALLLHVAEPCCAQQKPPNPPDLLTGETLYYKINFWLLRGSAAGELCFTKTPDGYRACFEAETRGILRFVTGARKEIMESVMEYDEARQRLRPRMFRETFSHNEKIFTRTIVFDYEHGAFTCTRIYPWGKPRTTQAQLPDAQFEDILTLYYNFRMGCYGPLPDSGTLRVPVIMKEQPSFIHIEFPPAGSKERQRGFSAILSMTRDLTHAFSRRVLTLLTPEGMLQRALVVDAYFFGDLTVNLTGMSYH